MNKSVLFVLMLLISSCAQTQTSPSSTNTVPSLFERIGGLPVLTVVVSETIDRSVNDPKIKRSFDGIKLSTLKQSVVDQLCVLTGGNCVYEGETMQNSHRDLKITTAEFELFVEAFRTSLNKHVGEREKNELLKILAPMKRDIVTD
ncbi:MAG: group 1 truncated hemoglobin [Methylotenera sp.]|jgi:hemoglobin|uniref:group I truncated hemoglobin n=1 Tax=Methylotenera sp. TaxID=2051956 RepID=UPI00271766A0|nr:group 1 truncated hemoglobin [Methylotenera sp.]MDO9151022.1 group 1 truncated hemoglobin [Methylotenera sp.]